jgi:imidazole glycerol-phosphate synthase subunit HisF
MSDVVIVNSGVANLASVAGAFRRLGADVRITDDPSEVRAARRLVLPGVGSFGAGTAALASRGLDAAVHEAVSGGTSLLGICLGLQMLCRTSEETAGVAGLGLIEADCYRLPEGVLLPHLGWNHVEPDAGCRLIEPGDAAYANSFALREAPEGWAAAWSVHGEPFVAALERDNILACQFHPELSGAWGAALLQRWLDGVVATREASRVEVQGSELSDMVATSRAADGAPPDHASRITHHASPVVATRRAGVIRRLVPCLDVRDGRVVKGVQFQGLRDIGDPAELAAAYEAQGADEIVVLDIAASPGAQETQVETVERVRAALGIPLTVGGGVRSVDDARRLLAAGADKVSVNTAAVSRPELLADMADAFGRQCVVLAIDARRAGNSWEVLIMGGRASAGLDAVEWAARAVALGAGEILLTSWDRDGTRAGHDLELLAAVTEVVSVPVIASGGIGTREHVAEAFAAGAEAVLAASILHDSDDTVRGIKESLAGSDIPVRL